MSSRESKRKALWWPSKPPYLLWGRPQHSPRLFRPDKSKNATHSPTAGRFRLSLPSTCQWNRTESSLCSDLRVRASPRSCEFSLDWLHLPPAKSSGTINHFVTASPPLPSSSRASHFSHGLRSWSTLRCRCSRGVCSTSNAIAEHSELCIQKDCKV